jgi:DNA-binding winged helix-turn-helix (wHTH) protein
MAHYRRWAGLEESGLSRETVEARVDALVQAVRPLSPVGIERKGGQITFHLPMREPLVCPDPVATTYSPLEGDTRSVVCRLSPGRVTPESVLVDANHHTWLTDVTFAGQAPQWWDFLCLEAAVRFGPNEAAELVDWYDFERCLVEPASLLDSLHMQDLMPALASSASLIEQIRWHANGETGSHPEPYYAGLLVWAVRAMAEFAPGKFLPPDKQSRAAHLLLGAAMLARRLGQEMRGTPLSGKLRLDEDGTVWIGGQRVEVLTGLELKLMQVLYEHAPRVVLHAAIMQAVWNDASDDESSLSRLSTLVRRLREKVEPNASRHQYILTVRGRGYRLDLDGGSGG